MHAHTCQILSKLAVLQVVWRVHVEVKAAKVVVFNDDGNAAKDSIDCGSCAMNLLFSRPW